MEDSKRRARNVERLKQLYPAFAARLRRVIETLEAAGLRPRIQDAWRSQEDQLKAFNAGNSKLKYGFHNVTGKDGTPEALAVDLLDDDNPLNSRKSYLLQLAAAARAAGVATGVRWGVPQHLLGGLEQAIENADWDANVKIGWDPTHVEPVGIKVSEARAGKRPN